MITVCNEFETIPAFETLAGCNVGENSPRSVVTELVKVLEMTTQADCSQYWRDIATSMDDDDYLVTLQDDLAQEIEDRAPIADYCTVSKQGEEWVVLPYIDEDLQRFDETPTETQGSDHILVISDHGNVTCMWWDCSKNEYVEIWSMV